MSERLKAIKEKSQKRRELLAKQLGVSDPKKLSDVLRSKEEQAELEASKKQTVAGSRVPAKKRPSDMLIDTSTGYDPMQEMMEKEKELKRQKSESGEAAAAEEEEMECVYTDSSAFLKGTQSSNPHNDYCQHFVDTGERPQNFIRDVGLANRFEEYPKLRELIRLKDELIQKTNTPPMYSKCDLTTFDLRDLETKFDAIMIDAPLEEYQRSLGLVREKYMSWEEIERLEIEGIAAQRSFIWIWCGSSDGLDAGRRCLKKWGYRRCEDICWIKTNIKNPTHNKNLEPRAVFQRTKEHCLMGIKGTVRRSVDGDFIHANVDIDLIIEEEKPWGSAEKPVEIFHMIEHFCLGRRRLHICGNDSSIRPGWVTVGPDLTSSNYDPDTFNGFFNNPNGNLTGCSDEIERLRPKSPPPKMKGGDDGRRGRGGRGRGGRGGGRGGDRGRGRGGMGGRGGGQSR